MIYVCTIIFPDGRPAEEVRTEYPEEVSEIEERADTDNCLVFVNEYE